MKRSPVVSRVAMSTEEMTAMVTHLTTLSCWFEVEPMPNDQYEIMVKADVEHVAFPILSPYTVLVLRPDYAAQNYGQDTFLTQVAATTVLAAQRLAQREAAEADHLDSPQDYHVLLVVEGHHFDQRVEDAT